MSVIDAICVVVGIVVGTFIFFGGPKLVALNTGSSNWMLLAWVFGGFFCLCGALTYAELATTYPKSGGEYSYISQAFGPEMGFLFVWARSTVIQTGFIAVLAYVFGDCLAGLLPILGRSEEGLKHASMIYALVAVVGLTVVNAAGWRTGKWTQNILTAVKVLGVLAIILVGLVIAKAAGAEANEPAVKGEEGAFGLAMVFVLITFGGWNEAAYVAGEVRNPRRNMIWVLLGSIVALTILYVAINFAYVRVLGFQGIRNSPYSVAPNTLEAVIGTAAGVVFSVFIALSALGGMNGCIFTGARAMHALGSEYPAFRPMGRWSQRFGTPFIAIIVQSAIAVILIVLPQLGPKFEKAFGAGFKAMAEYTAPTFWTFMLLTALSVFVLRTKEPGIERPFRVPFYPATALLFVLMCQYMMYSSLAYTQAGALVGVGVLLAGVPVYAVCALLAPKKEEGTGAQKPR
jgi:amino acid transporter